MRPDIKFHCTAEGHFKKNQFTQAFLYSNYSIERHNHDFYEINIVLNGKGIHEIENSHFNVKTGDVFVIPPSTVHAYYDTENLDVYHILLHKKFIADNQKETSMVQGFLQLTEIEPFLRSHFSNAMFLHLSQNQILQLKPDLKIIDDYDLYADSEFTPLKYHTIWKILYWFSYLLYIQLHSSKKSSSNKYSQPILQSLEYIHQNFGEKISIDLLCRQTFLSRSTFLRNFQDICGCSPTQYLTEYRCKKAVDMLENTAISKTEIAHICGFYDLSHMEYVLKKR